MLTAMTSNSSGERSQRTLLAMSEYVQRNLPAEAVQWTGDETSAKEITDLVAPKEFIPDCWADEPRAAISPSLDLGPAYQVPLQSWIVRVGNEDHHEVLVLAPDEFEWRFTKR